MLLCMPYMFQHLPCSCKLWHKFHTPSSMNRLFSELFKDFSEVILEVRETIWGSFWRCFGNKLEPNNEKLEQLLFFTIPPT